MCGEYLGLRGGRNVGCVWRIFGPKRDKVTEEWRNYMMRSLTLCTPHPIFWVIKSRRMRWAGHIECRGKGDSRGVCRVLVGKPEGKRLLVRSRHRWEVY